MSSPNVVLNNGVEIPQIGFGVYQVAPADTVSSVGYAFECGYRHIDTAALYGNEAEVGAAIAASGLDRDDIFVTTKIWNSDQGYDSTLRAFDIAMTKLDLDELDLLLIHWPASKQGLYVETYRAMEKLYKEGRVRSIGVSNFATSHLERLLADTSVVPVINQVELHPLLPQAELREFNSAHGIVTEAWAPLARARLMESPVITAIAVRTGKTPAQVILRWHIDIGNVAIPKSVTPSRIAENFDVFDFSLTPEDLSAIATLEDGTRIGPAPDSF